jgi:hypothetical protein
MNKKRVLLVALFLGLAAAVLAVPGIQLAGGPTERLANGGFEEGFHTTPAGLVGNGWGWFDNGGAAKYGFYDDTWEPVVAGGSHSQLIEINTFGLGVSEPDRYAGIYQQVAVVPGEHYDFSLQGMLRAMEDDPDRSGYNYRVQVGVDYSGGTDWTAVTNWVELPWDTVYPRLSPGTMSTYNTTLQASTNRLTIFIRAWKKWGTTDRELDVNLDAISLKGAMPEDTVKPTVSFTPPAFPVAGWGFDITVHGTNDVGVTRLEFYDDSTLVGRADYAVGLLSLTETFTWQPATAGSHTLKAIAYDVAGKSTSHQADVVVGAEGSFLTNGGFEQGFAPIQLGVVGKGWGWFYNDARATYGFYDDTWAPVIYEGKHSQLIEINTKDWGESDANRYAGIYQKVEGLTKGATYRLVVHGMLRVLESDDDRSGYNYRVQWGYDPTGGTDWKAVDNWVELPWNTVYTRLDPGPMNSYMTTFEAPSTQVTIFFRAWKKWRTLGRELDVNLDSISLKGYK